MRNSIVWLIEEHNPVIVGSVGGKVFEIGKKSGKGINDAYPFRFQFV